MAMTGADAELFTAFVTARSAALLRTAYLLTGDERAAEDLLQSALLKTLQHWRRIRDHESLDGFVRRVMVNERRSWHRRKSSHEVVTDAMQDQPGLDGAGDIAEADMVRRALMALPHRQRATLVLRFFEDLPEADVAAALGCSVGTVKSQTSKGLAHLRTALRALEPEEYLS
jgi:RNA polymerase sigma-70 factor (sigma-E family)